MINFEIYQNGKIKDHNNNIKLLIAEQNKTLFIFHGLYGRGKNWQSFAKKISQNEEILVFTVDLRNHGGNIFKENMSYNLMMEDIFHLFNYLEYRENQLVRSFYGWKISNVNYLIKTALRK